MHSSSLPDLEHRLAELTIPDYASLEDHYKIVNNTILEFVSGLPHNEPMQIAGERRKAVDRCFAPINVKDILKRLEDESKSSGSQAGWAEKALVAIQGRSPTSLKVTALQMAFGSRWSIMEAFEKEHQIATRFMHHPDFVEGVSARLIRKPAETPKWQPASLSDISDEEANRFFEIPEGSARLQLLRQQRTEKNAYMQYPHAWTTLPKERYVAQLIKNAIKDKKSMNSEGVLEHFTALTNGKPGVREVLQDILQRQTRQEGEQLVWLTSQGSAGQSQANL